MQLQFKGEEGVGSAKDLITIALLPPSSLPLSIYIYHQLANCSNLPSTVKMKTSRVRVHRNSVYYRNSRITSWRANEQSIVPPTPETRCPKNFASTGSAARKQVLRIGTVKRCSIRGGSVSFFLPSPEPGILRLQRQRHLISWGEGAKRNSAVL